jgi:hypothetical protein
VATLLLLVVLVVLVLVVTLGVGEEALTAVALVDDVV